MSLADRIRQEIRHNGPMNVATFMGLVISHYYNSRDPFGRGGDFTTAPEVSQMFGELIGAWAADCWLQMGQPEKFALVECGPGRGTLMADALRATKQVSGFHASMQIYLIEISETLQQKQREALDGYSVRWQQSLDDVPEDRPVILLANEFLDALPVRQLQFAGGQWQERVIGLDDNDALAFGLAPFAALSRRERDTELRFPGRKTMPALGEGQAIYEFSPVRENFVQAVCRRLHKQGGAALFIDYGYTQGHGDTLQAMKDHQYVDVLQHIGEADLTAHVDFAALKQTAEEERITVFGPVTQGAFLQHLGIAQRAAMLKQNASAQQMQDIDAALTRLTAKDEMGELFKVMALAAAAIQPAGF